MAPSSASALPSDGDEEPAFPALAHDPEELGHEMIDPRPLPPRREQRLALGEPVADPDRRNRAHVLDAGVPKPGEHVVDGERPLVRVGVLVEEPDALLVVAQAWRAKDAVEPERPVAGEPEGELSQA